MPVDFVKITCFERASMALRYYSAYAFEIDYRTD